PQLNAIPPAIHIHGHRESVHMSKKSRSSRWTGWLTRKPSILKPFPSLQIEELENRVVPSTFSWSGLGSTNNWSEAANWMGGTAPTGVKAEVDDLVFPPGPVKKIA